jgi:hypothetical protein
MRTSVADIVREVAAKHGLPEKMILSQCRQRAYAWPRQEAYYRIITECPHISYPEAGRRLGGKDHTTVLHGVRAHCKRNGLSFKDVQTSRRWQKTPLALSVLAEQFAQTMEAARVQ